MIVKRVSSVNAATVVEKLYVSKYVITTQM